MLCEVEDAGISANATAKSRRLAEQKAAAQVLDQLVIKKSIR